MLHSDFIPWVNRQVRKYGEYVCIHDLRWGLETGETIEDDAIAKAIEICLEQIKKCSYNMIILLGDFYGTVPRLNIIRKSLPDVITEISVTQCEIEYGVLRREKQELGNVLCCFRNLDKKMTFDSSEEQMHQLKQLKEKLANIGREEVKCIAYDTCWNDVKNQAEGLTQLREQLEERIVEIAEKKYEEKPNWAEQEFQDAESFCGRMQSVFGGRSDEIQKLISNIHSGKMWFIAVWGDSGIGKSSLLSEVYRRCKDRSNACFIACGYGERSQTYLDILRLLNYFIDKHLNTGKKGIRAVDEILTEEKGEDVLRENIQRYMLESEKNLIIFVDALDKLTSNNKIRLEALFHQDGKAKIVIVCSQIEKFDDIVDKQAVMQVLPLKDKDIREIFIKNTFSQNSYINRMISKFKELDNVSPLYIMMAIGILKTHLKDTSKKTEQEIYLGFLERITAFSETLNDVSNACWKFIEEIGEYLGVEQYRNIVKLIALTSRGIREYDLERILSKQWKSIEFARFTLFLSQFLYCGFNGKWNYSHDLMKEGVCKYINKSQGEADMEDQLYEYLKTKEANDEMRVSEGLYLSVKRNEYELPMEIFGEAVTLGEEIDHTLVILTLHEIIETENGKKWYLNCIQKNPILIGQVLYKGLYFTGAADYARRYPAYELAKIFWEQKGMELLESSEDLSIEERRLLCILCIEYVGILDDISKNRYALPYINYAVQYIKRADVLQLENQQKIELFRLVNMLFFANNRLINIIKNKETSAGDLSKQETELIHELSKELISWYKINIEPDTEIFQGNVVFGKFLNNIGQYYNAIKEYTLATPYRIKSLEIKLITLCKILKIDVPEWQGEMQEVIGGLDFHEKFWRAFLIQHKLEIENQIKSENIKKNNNTRNAWNAIGVTYRSLATDYCDLADSSKKDRLKNLELSKNAHEMCLWFQEQEFINGQEKDNVVTCIRWIGVAARIAQITEQVPDNILDIIIKSCNIMEIIYKNEEKERENLLDNMNLLLESGCLNDNLRRMVEYQKERMEDCIL